MNITKKLLYIILGTVFLVLGAIGLFLPLLPTTPFWLLTCWFYLRSSEKLYDKVLANDLFGSYVKGYLVDKSITLRSKITSISVMWVSTIISVVIVDIIWVGIIIIIINILVTWHILSFPTKKCP
jgi:Uncharacterized protein conserved in bacteria